MLTVVDLDAQGQPVRENRCELVFTGRDRDVTTAYRNALAARLERDANSYYSGYRQHNTVLAPTWYRGAVPTAFQLTQGCRQWEPQLVRSLTFEPTTAVPKLHWDALAPTSPNPLEQLVTDIKGPVAAFFVREAGRVTTRRGYAQEDFDTRGRPELNQTVFSRGPLPGSEELPIRLCLVGKDDPHDRMLSLNRRMAQKREIQVRRDVPLGQLKDCGIVFVGATESRQLPTVVRQLGNAPVLLISDDRLAVDQGAHLVLLHNDDRVEFEVNLLNLQKSNLRASSQMLKLARTVIR
jgi:hypothetical protein